MNHPNLMKSVPYSPQQNGMAVDRRNRTLKNMVNDVLITSSAPQNFWGIYSYCEFYSQEILNKKKRDTLRIVEG